MSDEFGIFTEGCTAIQERLARHLCFVVTVDTSGEQFVHCREHLVDFIFVLRFHILRQEVMEKIISCFAEELAVYALYSAYIRIHRCF